MKGFCTDCGNFPCIEDMKSRNTDRKYWASLIHADGCQSHERIKKEAKTT